MPLGILNCTFVPTPSTDPAVVIPAIVVTDPDWRLTNKIYEGFAKEGKGELLDGFEGITRKWNVDQNAVPIISPDVVAARIMLLKNE